MKRKTAAIAILEQLASENRRVLSDWRAFVLLRRATFSTPQEMRRWTQIPRWVDDVHPLLRQMAARTDIDPLAGLDHIYRVTVPYARTGDVRENEILMEVNPYAAISHLSALVFHGLTDDLPQELIATVPATYPSDILPPGTTGSDWENLSLVRGYRPAAILGWRMRWMRVAPDRYFGFREYQPEGYPVRVMMPERTLIDGLQDPPKSGGFENVLRAWVRARDTLDLEALVEIVDRINIGVLRQRVGFILDQLALRHPTVEAWSTQAKRGGSSKLVGSAPYNGSNYCERWNLSINAPVTTLKESVV